MTQLVDLVRFSFVIKDYQVENLNLLVKLEQGNSDVPDYTPKLNDYHSFWKSKISEKFGTYLYIMGLLSEPLDMVTPHLGTRENCLLVSKGKRILGLRPSKN
jgi:hypothetical protein